MLAGNHLGLLAATTRIVLDISSRFRAVEEAGRKFLFKILHLKSEAEVFWMYNNTYCKLPLCLYRLNVSLHEGKVEMMIYQ